MKLTSKNLDTFTGPATGNRIYYDAEGRGAVRGLGLRVTAAGARSWVLNYRSPDGRERRGTLGRYPDLSLEQARNEAVEWRARINRSDSPVDPLEAKKARRQLAQREREAHDAAPTIARLASMWLERHARIHKRASSYRNDMLIFDKHLLPRFGNRKVAMLTRADLELLMTDMAGTPIQANRTLALCTTVMQYAVNNGFRASNPCLGVKRFPENKRVVHVSRASLDQLYTALERHPNRQATNAIKLLVWTGARRGEVLGAQWSEFDLDRGLWIRPAARVKQKRASVIPLNPLALGLLREMRSATSNDQLVFPAPRPSDHGRARRDLRTFWNSIVRQAGLGSMRIHDLRHVFATAMLEDGVPLDAIAPLLGHASTVMTKTYATWSVEALQRATATAGRRLAIRVADSA